MSKSNEPTARRAGDRVQPEASPSSVEPRMTRTLMASIAVILAFDMALYAAVAPLLPGLQRELGLTGAQVGLFMAAYPIGLVLTAVPAGQVAARWGPREVTIAGSLILAGASVTFGFATTFVLLLVLRAVQGAAAALTWAGGLAWISGVAPASRHGTLIGMAISASVAGGVLGPVLGAAAVGTTRTLLFVAVGVAVGAASVGLFTQRGPSAQGTAAVREVIRGLASRDVVPLAWTVLLCAVLTGALLVHLPLRLDDLGGSAGLIGVTFTAVATVEIVAGPLLGRLHDRAGPRLPLVVCLASVGTGLLLMVFVDRLGLLIALVVLAMPGAALLITPALAGLNAIGTRRGLAVAALFGLTNFLWAVGESVGALAAGWLLTDPASNLGLLVLLAVVLGTIPVIVRANEAPAPAGSSSG